MNMYTMTNEDLEEQYTQVARGVILTLHKQGHLTAEQAEDLAARILIVRKEPGFFRSFFLKFFKKEDEGKDIVRVMVAFMDPSTVLGEEDND